MPATARACVFHGANRPLTIEPFNVPSPARGEALVRVTCATICGSDLHTYTGRRQEATPTVLGHETLGRVEALGPGGPLLDVRGRAVAIGDRVSWSVAANCGVCFYCREDLPQKCAELFKYGHARLTPERPFVGGLAEYCQLQSGTAIVVLPDSLSDFVACPASCATATVAGALRTAGGCRGRVVLVQGAGMLGLTACAMAQTGGAARVIAVDPDPARRDQARQFGTDDAVAPGEALTEVVLAATEGRGVDLALELSGATPAIEAGLALLRTGGRYVLAGAVLPMAPVALEPQMVVRRMLTIQGLHNYAPCDLAAAVEFLDARHRRYPFASLVGGPFMLDDAEAAFRQALAGREPRVAVVP